jgi:Flp pilus assembly protein TadD
MFIDKEMFWKAIVFFLAVYSPISFTQAQTKTAINQIGPALQILDSTKEQDGLVGSVRRVKTEFARINIKDGRPMEGPRQLLELTTYGVKGNRVDNVSYPIADSTAGREEYKYDNRGNIIEKILRDERGSVLSREAYDYVFDKVGNWTKMTTSLMVVENGEFKREPTEVTYRTFTYYATNMEPRTTTARIQSGEPAQQISQLTERIERTSEPEVDRASMAESRTERSQPAQPISQSSERIQKTPEAVVDRTSITNTSKPPETIPVNSTLNTQKTEELGIETKSVLKSAPADPVSIVPTAEVVGAAANRSVDTATSTPKNSAEVSDPEPTSNPAVTPRQTRPQDPSFVVTSVLPSESTKKSETALERQPVASSTVSRNALSSAPPNSSSSTKAFEVYEVGRRQFDAGDVNGAIASYLESLRLEPSSAEVQMNLGHAYLTTKKDKEAMKAFKEAVRLNPELAEGFYGLAFISFRSKNYKEATDAFKKAIALSPNMAKAHYGLALAYIELQKLDDMIQEYRLLQRLDAKLAAKLAQAFPDIRRCEGTAYCR